uniref:Uncharacterized protein n=1 Tax=Timema poppense TaxID=170557 RepID=A0A7R9H8A7_TIMPO|nr:unnamed protein product [Timema poppensis]
MADLKKKISVLHSMIRENDFSAALYDPRNGGSSGSAQGLVDVAINMTRAMSTLMGQVIQGAAQSLQSFVRERTGNLAKYFSFGSG